MKTMNPCSKCDKSCVFKDVSKSKEIKDLFGGPCDLCKLIICRECSGISANKIRVLTSPSRLILYYCHDCRNVIRSTVTEMSNIQAQIKKLQDNVKPTESEQLQDIIVKETAKLRKETESFKKQIRNELVLVDTALQTKIDEAKEMLLEVISNTRTAQQVNKVSSYAEITALQTKVQKIEERSNMPRTQNPENNLAGAPLEPAIMEIQEREKRAANILIFGMKEIVAESREERLEKESKEVKNLIRTINSDISMDSIQVIRLGPPYKEQKLRPIKVIFTNKADAQKIMQQRSKIENTGCYIKRDQTLAQRNYIKSLINELKERQNKGEDNIRIKYFEGNPKIIKTVTKQPTSIESKNQHRDSTKQSQK